VRRFSCGPAVTGAGTLRAESRRPHRSRRDHRRLDRISRSSCSCGIVPLRRAAFGFVFTGFKKVLPEMSSTEREALEAGDVWWRRDVPPAARTGTSCSTSATRSSPKKSSASRQRVRGTVQARRRLEGRVRDKDLPPEVWAYHQGEEILLDADQEGVRRTRLLGGGAVVRLTKLATKSRRSP